MLSAHEELLFQLPARVASRTVELVGEGPALLSAGLALVGAIAQSPYVQLFKVDDSELTLIAERVDTGMASYPAASREGLIGRAVRTARTVWAPDVTKEADYIPAEESTRSELVIPIFNVDTVQLVINIERTIPNAYSPDQIRWLESFVRAYPFSSQWATPASQTAQPTSRLGRGRRRALIVAIENHCTSTPFSTSRRMES